MKPPIESKDRTESSEQYDVAIGERNSLVGESGHDLTHSAIVKRLKNARNLSDEREKHKAYAMNFEVLGDWYFRESDLVHEATSKKHRMRLKAVCLYNLALASRGDQQILMRKIQLIEEGILIAAGGKSPLQSTNEYIKEVNEYKHDLAIIRKIAKDHLAQVDIASIEIKEIYHNIATGLKRLIKKIIEKCFTMNIPPAECNYSIIVLGSLAREEATPFSDLEWAILIGEDNEQHKDYFRRLTELVWIKILNLQETTPRMMDLQELEWFTELDSPCRKGLSFDGQMLSGCHTPLGNLHHEIPNDQQFELIGTPEELAQYQLPQWEKKRGFCTVLSTVVPIVNNDNDTLIKRYQANLKINWLTPVEKEFQRKSHINGVKQKGLDTVMQRRSLKYLLESIELFQFRGGNFNKEINDNYTHYFDVKYHLYRLPNMLIDHLATFFGAEVKNLWDLVKELFAVNGRITNISAFKKLTVTVSKILAIRLHVYLKKGYRNDDVIMLNLDKSINNALLLEEHFNLSKVLIFEIYTVLIQLQWRIEEFIYQPDRRKYTLEAEFVDYDWFIQAEIHRLLLNYSEAIEGYNKVKQKYKETHGKDHILVAKALNNLGNIYNELSQFDKAIKMLKKAKKIKTALLGRDHIFVADTLRNIGNCLESQSYYHEAISAYSKGMQIYLNKYQSHSTKIADVLTDLGGAYCSQKEYGKAIEILNQAREILTECDGYNNESLAMTLNALGIVYLSQSRFSDGIEMFEKAMKILISLYGYSHWSVALTLNNLGCCYESLSDYDNAIESLEKAMRIKKIIYGISHVSVADTLNNLGVVYEGDLRLDEALDAYNKALVIYNARFGIDHVKVADVNTNIGNLYKEKHQYHMAIESYEVSRTLYVKFNEIISLAETLNNIGEIYLDQSLYAKAISVFEEARVIYAAQNMGIKVADTLNNLGDVYVRQWFYPEAMSCYNSALTIYREKLGEAHINVGKVLNNIGQVYTDQYKFDEGRKLLQEALEIFSQYEDSDSSIVESNLSYSYLREGNLFLLQKNPDYVSAVNCYLNSFLHYDPQDIEHHETLAMLFYLEGKLNVVIEQSRVIIRLQDENASAHEILASMLHIRANIELDRNDQVRHVKYLTEAKNHFETAIKISQDSVIIIEYASFLWRNKNYCKNSEVIDMLNLAIKLSKYDEELFYTMIDRPALDPNLQLLLDENNKISLKAVCYAYYLLIQIYCESDHVYLARKALEKFEVEIKKISEIDIEYTKVSSMSVETRLLDDANRLVLKSAYEDIKFESSSETVSLHNQIEKLTSPPLLRDSPILGVVTKNTISEDEKIETSLNLNL